MSKKRNKGPNKLLSAIITAIAVIILISYYFPDVKDFLSDIFDSGRKATLTDGEMSVHFLDVDQGDSILIMSPSGQTMLIDTSISDQADNIIEYLKSYKIKKLDYLVLTHPDSDHIGGASKILKEIGAGKVIMTDITHTSKTFERLLETIDESNIPLVIPKLNQEFSLGNAVVTVLGPVEKTSDLNEMSLVLRLDYGKKSFLFTADAGISSEKEMLKKHPSSAFKADVLKLGHHGSSTSSSNEFLSAVSPEYAIVSCGKDNSYGHPHDETVDKIHKRNIKLYRTDKDGSIVFSTDGKNIKLLRPAS